MGLFSKKKEEEDEDPRNKSTKRSEHLHEEDVHGLERLNIFRNVPKRVYDHECAACGQPLTQTGGAWICTNKHCKW